MTGAPGDSGAPDESGAVGDSGAVGGPDALRIEGLWKAFGIGPDQLQDYAARKGVAVVQVEKWLLSG